jgi:hypothetical protein
VHIGERRHHKTIDTPQQVVLRDAIIEMELIEKACLIAAPPIAPSSVCVRALHPAPQATGIVKCLTSVRRRAWLHRQRLPSPVVALSLGGLRRRRIEALMVPDSVDVVLLDGLAERERHRRQA